MVKLLGGLITILELRTHGSFTSYEGLSSGGSQNISVSSLLRTFVELTLVARQRAPTLRADDFPASC